MAAAFHLAERLTLDNAKLIWAAGLSNVDAGQTEIDLGPLKKVDSAALAVLLAWQRAARSHGNSLVLTNWPANLETLAHLYDVADLLESPR